MSEMLRLKYDQDIVDEIAGAFALRDSNTEAMHELVHHLSGRYDPSKQQVMHMATGSGKTYLMAAFIEYLRRQSYRNVVIITPGLIVQSKTVLNFTQGSRKYIEGVDTQFTPNVFTPKTLYEWSAKANQNSIFNPINLFVFNIQQILRPTSMEGKSASSSGPEAQRRGVRKTNEAWGNVFKFLQEDDQLVVIADESHSYSVSAEKFHQAIADLDAAAVIGLSASSDEKDANIEIVHKYPLYQAISDGHVKKPVIAFRKGGYKDASSNNNEELQLRDAKMLLNRKTDAYQKYIKDNGVPAVNPVLFVVCADTAHAEQIRSYLASPEMFGSEERILRIDTETKDNPGVIDALNNLDQPDSPIRAVVSVNMLKEGWDVKNVAVICSLRASASEVLTQQTMGRGLRLPFGKLTGVKMIDQLDILSHEAFENMLDNEDIHEAFDLVEALPPEKDDMKPKDPKPKQSSSSTGEGSTTKTGTEDADPGGTSQGTGALGAPESTAMSGDDGQPKDEYSGAEGGIEQFTPDEFSDEEKTAPAKLVEPKTFKINEAFKGLTFWFPRSVFDLERRSEQFTPAKVDDQTLRNVAGKVSGSGAVIERKLIAVSEKLNKVFANTTVSAEGYAEEVNEADVIAAITDEVIQAQFMTRTPEMRQLTEAKVRTFVRATSVKWTVASVEHAKDLLFGEFRRVAREVSSRHIKVRKLEPTALPIKSVLRVPDKDAVRERNEPFERKEPYRGYLNGLFPVAMFDAHDTEFQIAELLEASSSVSWWKRLYDADQATIAYGRDQKYFPDFVVCEGSDYWIVEGKRSDQMQSDDVQAKAIATRETLGMTPADPRFAGQLWHYLLLDENMVKHSNNWEDLKKYEY